MLCFRESWRTQGWCTVLVLSIAALNAQSSRDALCLAATQARSLTVVLREPCDVAVPLATAAALPADAMGRCALTTQAVVDRFRDAPPWHMRAEALASLVWAWLDEVFPHRNAPFHDIAELDGAAAMRAAVPSDARGWLQLLDNARGL